MKENESISNFLYSEVKAMDVTPQLLHLVVLTVQTFLSVHHWWRWSQTLFLWMKGFFKVLSLHEHVAVVFLGRFSWNVLFLLLLIHLFPDSDTFFKNLWVFLQIPCNFWHHSFYFHELIFLLLRYKFLPYNALKFGLSFFL